MSKQLRIVVAAVGWTGHAYPAFALARELGSRGHQVTVQTFERWRDTVAGFGAGFVAAREQMSFGELASVDGAPTLAESTHELGRLIADLRPDVMVHDLFTLAPAFAAESAGLRRATLIPHPYPVGEPGLPPYTLGLLAPRTRLGSQIWRAASPAIGANLPNTRLRATRAALNRTRSELGLRPLAAYDAQISPELALVATFPQLEYPRRWPVHAHVVGPMPFALEHPDVELPAGDAPLVVVASSTERDPQLRLIAGALEALADEPVRVIASINRPGASYRQAVPRNAVVVDWLAYDQVLPGAAAVVCHGGHGTVARALAAGVPVIVSPAAGEMAENGARVAWSGCGLMIPNRLLGPGSLRHVVRRLLGDRRFAERAAELAAWAGSHPGAKVAANLVEALAA